MITRRAGQGLALAVAASCLAVASGGTARVNAAETARERFRESSERLGARDADGWVKLADFCNKNHLWDQWEACLKKAAAISPGHFEARRLMGQIKVGNEWLTYREAEAREEREQAAQGKTYYGRTWVTPEQRDPVRARERREVGWDFEHKIETTHVTIYSDDSLAVSRDCAGMCENTGYAYWEFYQRVLDLRKVPPLKVFVLKDRDRCSKVYESVARGRRMPAQAAGLYDHGCGILFVRTDTGLGDADHYLSTMAHEMVHALDHRVSKNIAGKLPTWLHEGRAEHLGTYARFGRTIVPGFVRVDPRSAGPLVLAKAIESTSLAELMKAGGSFQFKEYCTSFALVHFLFHGEDGKYADGFRWYLNGLPGKASLADFEARVGKLAEIEPRYKSYVREVLVPGMLAGRDQRHLQISTGIAAEDPKEPVPENPFK